MVKIHIKRGNDSLFLFETETSTEIINLIDDLLIIYNGIKYILKLSADLEDLCRHEINTKPKNSDSLDGQLSQLVLSSDSTDTFQPSEGHVECNDLQSACYGWSPNDDTREIISKVTAEAYARVSKEQISAGVCLTKARLMETCEMLVGTVTTVNPKGFPSEHAINRDVQFFQDNPEPFLAQSFSSDCLVKGQTELWWAGKCLQPGKKLYDYVGTNEKTKIVAKIQKSGQGPASREPVMNDEEHKHFLLQQFKRQEELKKLSECEDTVSLDSEWGDNKHLQKSFQGLQDIKWRPR